MSTDTPKEGLAAQPGAPKFAPASKAVPFWLTVLAILMLPLFLTEALKTGMIPFMHGG